MKAVVVDHNEPSRVRIADVAEPSPGPSEAIIAVRAVSIKPGELASRVDTAEGGFIPGWEAAGVVVRAAADGSGPRVGQNVISFADGGGWAEFRAAPTQFIGTIDEGVDLVAASTLPIAAGSALRAIRGLGPVLGTRLLVTGASGAVGRFVVQLGARASADVVAVARNHDTHDGLLRLGAREVHSSISEVIAPVNNAVDTVGGPVLVQSFSLLRSHGTVITLGRASGVDSSFSAAELTADFGRSGLTLRTFFLIENPAGLDEDFTWLGSQFAAGELISDVSETVEFVELPSRLENDVRGKLVAVLPG